MSKQMRFVHTEEDILPILALLESHGYMLVDEHMLYSPTKMLDKITASMSVPSGRKYEFAYVPDKSFERNARFSESNEGTAIEFINCEKTLPDSNGYEIGRFYLRRKDDGEFDPVLLAVYKDVSRYLKKKYSYYKPLGVYFSPSFREGWENGILFVTHVGHVLDV